MGGSVHTNTLTKTMVVSVGDMAVSNSSEVVLSTYGLGTCIGVVMFDPKKSIGGMLHFMLPDSTLSPDKATKRPFMFADTGFSAMVKAFKELGADPQNMTTFIAGGASATTSSNFFNIGEKNTTAIKSIFNANKIENYSEDLGGMNNRTLHFKFANGELNIKTPVGTKTLSLL